MTSGAGAPQGCAPGPPPNSDGHGVGDASDNCRFLANTDQANADGDSLGDACFTDDDNDGIVDRAAAYWEPPPASSRISSREVAGPTTGED